jgi:hypothetical protein
MAFLGFRGIASKPGPRENSGQRGMFRKTKPPSIEALFLIVVVLLFPTHSYFIQEMRFWLFLSAIVTALGMLSIAAFILLRETARRGLPWMKLRIEKLIVLRHTMARQFLASLTNYWR